MDVPRHVLRYDPALSSPDTWRMLDSGRGIETRALVGGIEFLAEHDCRWHMRDPRRWPDAVYVSPADSLRSLWLSAPCRLGPELERECMQLEHAPEHAAKAMGGW